MRDFICIQNSSGYESLKSKGLDLIKNDSLRHYIINLYDFEYEIIEKLEENYFEMQFYQSFHKEFNMHFSKSMLFNDTGQLVRIQQPLSLDEDVRKELLTYLWRIENNRRYTMRYYKQIEISITSLINRIDAELVER